ncbi:MAG: helix-turn-helix transcriptional regulator [Clostridia bacterium]
MENLRKLRRAYHYTQIAVHMTTGIDQSLLSKYERGERLPSVENLLLLAKLYNTSLDYLMDLTDEASPYPRK